jgi:putative transposase
LNRPESFIKLTPILGILSHNPTTQTEIYQQLMKKARRLKTKDIFEAKDAVTRFHNDILTRFSKILKIGAKEKRTGEISGIQLMDPKELDEKIKTIRESNSYGAHTRKAKKYVIEQLIARGYKRREIAHRLNLSRKTVYNILKS